MLRDPMIYQRLQTTRLLLSQILLYFEWNFTLFQPKMTIRCPIFNLFFIWAEMLSFNSKLHIVVRRLYTGFTVGLAWETKPNLAGGENSISSCTLIQSDL